MKRILVIALMLTACFQAFGQYNFSIQQGKVIWQRVYEAPLTFEDLTDAVVLDRHFGDILAKDSTISCMLLPFDLEHESDGYAGYSKMQIPMYALGIDIEALVTIQVKDGRYRVTLERFIFIEKLDTPLHMRGDRNPLETWALNESGNFRNNFLKIPADIMNTAFLKLFNFPVRSNNRDAYLNDEW